jgi:hypothetical protein
MKLPRATTRSSRTSTIHEGRGLESFDALFENEQGARQAAWALVLS